ncbi:uncharacterized protein LOC117027337 isoform X2 [Rhinolophus ferrumequinum]|uniref:uncharacterized protein LOC117027337 isoform X2 n=1 Tax=Rhinolophus ferrumequinum TaxID=59479 RepID=UPI00140F50D4|nr:uncharacterized protein LOC117027337 isoform X2 [Rhinolophus ferrumequinum]
MAPAGPVILASLSGSPVPIGHLSGLSPDRKLQLRVRRVCARVFARACVFSERRSFSELDSSPPECPDGADNAASGSGEFRAIAGVESVSHAGFAGDGAVFTIAFLALDTFPEAQLQDSSFEMKACLVRGEGAWHRLWRQGRPSGDVLTSLTTLFSSSTLIAFLALDTFPEAQLQDSSFEMKACLVRGEGAWHRLWRQGRPSGDVLTSLTTLFSSSTLVKYE